MKDRFDNLVIPVDKSTGLSTYDVIRRFRKTVRVDKVGHSGTLDPLATGLVLILTGAATKLSNYLMELPKRYIADVRLGEATDTQDSTGTVVRSGGWDGVGEEQIRAMLPGFTGRRMQVPPMYSALKHKGTPLYALARKGQEIDRAPREVDTHEIELLGCDLPIFRIMVRCSRGMYVRVLAEEMGDALGVPACLHSLVRTEVGHFNLDSALKDTDFAALAEREKPGYSLSEALGHFPAVELTAVQARGLENGIAPRIRESCPQSGVYVRLLRPDGELGAIAETGAAGILHLKKVFNVAAASG